MNALDLLTWARGPGLAIALAVFLFGMLLRLIEIRSLGRKADLAVPRDPTPGSGWRTIMSRSAPLPGMMRRSPVTYLGGYVFHVGFFVVLVFFIPHVELARGLLGIGWPGLPSAVIDATAVASIAALVLVLVDRLRQPVKRFLTTGGDYLAWALTILPLATGYVATHHLLGNYTLMLALHVLSVELLLVVMPFTKLTHAVTVFVARWYNGDLFARKGVAS